MSLKGPKLEKFKQRLLAKRRELITEVQGSNVGSLETSSDGIQDIADQASSAYTKEFLLSLTDTERKQLLQIDEALRSLDKGTYGLCLNCGQPISRKRLEALPWATYCIDCQQKLEQERS